MGHRISRPKAALSPAVLLLVATGVSGLATALLAAADDSSTELTPEMPEIVARSIEKHGGEGFRASEVRYQLCSKSGCVDVRVRRNGGLYEHEVEGDFGGEARRIVVGNDSVSLWIDGERREVAQRDEQRWRDMVTARMYHVFLPFKLVDPSVRFADLGLEAWGERQLHR
ncbi:MAG: hypothetical protein MI919_02770, partial [Holophagales bacterium]|nr:hypothetical protein [Holophagales bacterium]